MPKRIVVIDDDEACRMLYRHYFSHSANTEIIAEFDNAEDALPGVNRLKPDIVIVDHTLPGMSGIDFVNRLVGCEGIRVLLVTGHDREAIEIELGRSPAFEVIQKDGSGDFFERVVSLCG